MENCGLSHGYGIYGTPFSGTLLKQHYSQSSLVVKNQNPNTEIKEHYEIDKYLRNKSKNSSWCVVE